MWPLKPTRGDGEVRAFPAGSTVASMPTQHLFLVLPAVAVDVT